MAAGDLITDGLASLAQLQVAEVPLEDVVRRVVGVARETLAADMAGLTQAVDDVLSTTVYTHPEVPEMDAEQYRSDRGPCLEAWRTGAEVRIDDTAADEFWPEFCAGAVDHGVRATLSLPVRSTGSVIGALNLYSRRPGHFSDLDLDRVRAWSAGAATVIANAMALADARALNDNLREALRSRASIDQAIGLIMAGGGRTPEEAFQLLVRASQRENRKLRDVAQAMVEAASRRSRGPGVAGPAG
jgi:GAF domain-containing protein